MPYLVSVSQEQVDRSPSSGTVRVHWILGDQTPDLIEIRQAGASTTASVLIASIPIEEEAGTARSFDFVTPAPSFLSLVVSPRTATDGVLDDQMEDDFGESHYWESFSVPLPLLTVAASPGSSPPARPKPKIVGVDVREGEFTVRWESANVDHFNVTVVPSIVPFQGQLERAGSDRSFTQRKVIGGRTYRFSIQGCTQGIIRSNCSEWTTTDIPVSTELGYHPWRRWFPIPEGAFDHTTQQITAVSRTPGHLDLFVIGFNNAVWSTFWSHQTGWNPGGWFAIHPQGVFDQRTQKITALSRTPGHLDLFVIGFNNAVWSIFWSEQTGWNPGGWFQIRPERVFDHTTQQITALSRTPGHIDLFVIGFDNAVWSTFWSERGGWNPGWFQIHPETVFDHRTQQITALSRTPGHIDLFVIGFDNAVWSTFWSERGGWNPGGWFQIHPETVFAYTTQKITAVSRTPGHLDLFVIGFDNRVWSTFWSEAGGWNPGGWFQIHPQGVFDHTTQHITAVSRSPGHLDLFVIGFDNRVWSTFWSEAGGWNPGGWFQIRPEAVFDHTTQHITALSRTAGHLDLFVIGFDNAVWSTWWSAG